MFKHPSADSLIRYTVIVAIVAGIFVLDLLAPLGLAVPLLYVFPILLTNWVCGRREGLYLVAACSVLTILGFFLSSSGASLWMALFNRTVGLGVLWAMAVFMTGQQRAVEEKTVAVASQKSAEVARAAALEARAHADAAMLGAVTGRQSLEHQLRASESRLNGILQSAMDAIITVDDWQSVVLFNRAAETMFQRPAAEAIGQSIDQFIPQRFRGEHHKHIDAFGRSGTTSRKMGRLGTVMGLRAGGEEFPAEASISQITVDGKKYFTVILRDISERQRIEQQLRQSERLAEVGTLAAGLAHEIGTPMNVILGRAEQLMRKADDDATRKGLAAITTQVERITKIMNQLLTFARRKPSERRAMNLGRTIDDCLEVLQERIRRAGIKVETTYETVLHPLFVHADPDQMSQVFLNLLINAVHAMPDGGALRISLERADGHVQAVIADTGHGIPKEDLPKIFQPFFTTKEAGKGTGLGLTVVHNIVQEHGGSIAVDSAPGEGTTFTIMLPAGKQPAASG
jgi:PAS domain S-box-containing protein